MKGDFPGLRYRRHRDIWVAEEISKMDPIDSCKGNLALDKLKDHLSSFQVKTLFGCIIQLSVSSIPFGSKYIVPASSSFRENVNSVCER